MKRIRVLCSATRDIVVGGEVIIKAGHTFKCYMVGVGHYYVNRKGMRFNLIDGEFKVNSIFC
ncbi:hypothetical protein Sd1_gp70 [Shigella phage Sd1]|uniref:Uncharacterized protein n=1 Tax=Shigella phage Sd1 TaxID=2024313 RepID=A0A291AYN4_9CAUD|nr:hypothetical protein HOR98_gp58 [Shigella phage Sd1]ATE86136.1 hypothetical protein Sd1_gp70 [Shigella phage Sd1]